MASRLVEVKFVGQTGSFSDLHRLLRREFINRDLGWYAHRGFSTPEFERMLRRLRRLLP